LAHCDCDVVVRKHLIGKSKTNPSSSKLDLCTQRSHVTASSRCKSELRYHILSGSPTKPRKVWYCAICMLNLSGNS
jgi:hypothetical protein